jgi:manganese transport protein
MSRAADLGIGGVMEPPVGFLGALRYMGPGLILSAAIVGSGELVATTALGARAGFALLWVVLLGCVVKVAVQVEYGRQCMMWGQTTFQAWNRGRAGGGWRRLHWAVWVGMAYMVANMVGQGGVLGGGGTGGGAGSSRGSGVVLGAFVGWSDWVDFGAGSL